MGFLTRQQTMGVAALALGGGVLLSRVMGLVRDKVISYYFGAGAEADVYFMAFVVPDYLNYLLAGGYFSITLVPLLAQAFMQDEEDAWRFFSAAVTWAFLAIASCTLLAFIYARPLAALVAPGFGPEQLDRLALFLRIVLPAQAAFLPGACFTAILYLRKQFTVPALTPLVYNSSIILGGCLGVWLAPERGMEGFCWGVLAGAIVGSLALPVLAVRAQDLHFWPCLCHAGMKKVALLALPLMLGQSIVVLDEQFVRIFGSLTGDGGVSLINYARRIMQVPVGVIAQAAGLASYPFLAALAAKGAEGRTDFDIQLNTTLKTTVLVAVPVSLWLMVASEPVMRLIFQQGSFGAEEARQSGLLLALMLGAVTFWCVQQVLGRGFYAHQDTITPAVVGTVSTVAALPLYWLGAKYFAAPGVALAGSLGVGLYTLLLVQRWQTKHGKGALDGLGLILLRSIVYCLPAALAAYGANVGLMRWLAPEFFLPESLALALVRILGSGMAFALVWFGLLVPFAPDICAPVTGVIRRLYRKLAGK